MAKKTRKTAVPVAKKSADSVSVKQIEEFARGIEVHVIPKLRELGLRKDKGALRLRMKGVV